LYQRLPQMEKIAKSIEYNLRRDFMSTPSSEMELKDIFTPEQFKAIESSFVSKYGMPLESCGTNGKESLSLCSSPCHPYFAG